MIEFVRSRSAMVAACIAASLWAVGSGLAGVAYVVLSRTGTQVTDHLLMATVWLDLAAGLVALGAICQVTWRLVVTRRWPASVESASAGLGTLLFVVGSLMLAVAAPGPSNSGSLVAAIGLGAWAMTLCLAAARRALLEQDSPGMPRCSGFLLVGALAVVLIGVGFGLPAPAAGQATLAVATAVVWAVGFGVLAGGLLIALARRLLRTRSSATLIVAASLAAVEWLVAAVVGGLIFGPPPHTLTSIRVGFSVPDFMDLVAFGSFALAALLRIGEIPRAWAAASWVEPPPDGGSPPTTPGGPPAGWYADPAGGAGQRWWDGRGWTAHTHPSTADRATGDES